MKNILFVSLVAFLVTLSIASVVSASAGSLGVDISGIVIKDIEVSSGSTANIAGFSGQTVPVTVLFTSNTNVSDARISVRLGDDSSKSRKIHLVQNSVYSEAFSLNLPSDIEPEEEYTLYVRIETNTEYKEETFHVKIQRESYQVKILDVEADRTVESGSQLQVNVVVKNVGYEELEDLFVVVSIPDLNIVKRAYFSDLQSVDCSNDCGNSEQDSKERIVKLDIPANAKPGLYNLVVEASNSDTKEKLTKPILVSGKEDATEVFAPYQSKEARVDETITYDLIIVNSGRNVAVYQLTPEFSGNLVVSVDEPIVSIPAGTSKTVKVSAKASAEGSYTFVVNVASDNVTVEKVSLAMSVGKGRAINNVTVLTIVLAVIFIVLLVVLIVLLTRKPQRESFEESYY